MRFSFYIYCIFTELVVWLWRLSWHAHESDLAHRRRKTVCVMHVCSSFTTWSRRSDMFGLRPISSIKNKLDPLDLSYCEVAHIFHFFLLSFPLAAVNDRKWKSQHFNYRDVYPPQGNNTDNDDMNLTVKLFKQNSKILYWFL